MSISTPSRLVRHGVRARPSATASPDSVKATALADVVPMSSPTTSATPLDEWQSPHGLIKEAPMPLHTHGRAAGRPPSRPRSGLLAFNVITLEYAEAIVAGAAAAGRPVILAVSENATRFHGGDPRPAAAALLRLAEAADVPVALHLDHVTDRSLLEASADAGFSSVMFDAGALELRRERGGDGPGRGLGS